MNVRFVYRIIISEFCRIGKGENDVWIGGIFFWINFEFVEFFWCFGVEFVGEREDWEWRWGKVWERRGGTL